MFYQGTLNEQPHVRSAEGRYSCDTHRGERPYACELRNEAFIKKSHLKIHRRIHSGERPYVCDVCNKTFSDKSN